MPARPGSLCAAFRASRRGPLRGAGSPRSARRLPDSLKNLTLRLPSKILLPFPVCHLGRVHPGVDPPLDVLSLQEEVDREEAGVGVTCCHKYAKYPR